MICKEVMRKLEERWNPSYALEWDNVGLLVGREEKEIKKGFSSESKDVIGAPINLYFHTRLKYIFLAALVTAI